MKNVRLTYTKKGRMKFISHLDMTRYMSRVIKQSKIPVWHTEGFNKHLYLTFALPLSLGMTSDYDIIDIKVLDDDFPYEKMVESLNSVAANGIVFTSAAPVEMKTTELTFAEYKITYEDGNEELLDKLSLMFGSEKIKVIKKGKKGRESEINLSEKIKSIDISRKEGSLQVKIILPAGNTENINPMLFTESFEGIYGRRPEVVEYERTMLYNASMEIFK